MNAQKEVLDDKTEWILTLCFLKEKNRLLQKCDKFWW